MAFFNCLPSPKYFGSLRSPKLELCDMCSSICYRRVLFEVINFSLSFSEPNFQNKLGPNSVVIQCTTLTQ